MMKSNYNESSFIENDKIIYNEISPEESYNIVMDYILNIDSELKVNPNYIEFYGYFKYYIEMNDVIVGVVSVNGFSGQVWYQNWNGSFKELILIDEK